MYGIRLSRHDYGVMELADLVAHLPPGCALWRASGGPLAWTDEIHMLSRIEHAARVLAWMKTENGAKGLNPPKPEQPPTPGAVEREEQRARDAKAAAWKARQDRLAAHG